MVEPWLPLFLFAILFGISTDDHVFLLSRIKEQYDETADNAAAVVHGLRQTASIISGAALIMVAVFAGMASGDLVMLQQVGFGLAAAIIVGFGAGEHGAAGRLELVLPALAGLAASHPYRGQVRPGPRRLCQSGALKMHSGRRRDGDGQQSKGGAAALWPLLLSFGAGGSGPLRRRSVALGVNCRGTEDDGGSLWRRSTAARSMRTPTAS